MKQYFKKLMCKHMPKGNNYYYGPLELCRTRLSIWETLWPRGIKYVDVPNPTGEPHQVNQSLYEQMPHSSKQTVTILY